MEKAAWAATKEAEAKDLEEKRAELLRLQEQIRAEQTDITQQREQLYRKMEILTSQGLLISPNVALPVPVSQEDSSKESCSEESSPHSENAVITTTTGSISSGTHTTERRKDKWNKNSMSKSQLPMNLISTTNQQKVSQNLPIKQQIPLKLVSRLSSGSSSGSNSGQSSSSGSGPQQMLPLKLSQDEKTRRSSSGYQRLSSDSFSPPSSETVSYSGIF